MEPRIGDKVFVNHKCEIPDLWNKVGILREIRNSLHADQTLRICIIYIEKEDRHEAIYLRSITPVKKPLEFEDI
jgi:hypothetical protein